MNNSPLANSISVSVQIYRALLVAYPKKFREHYETQMVQVFRDSFREAYHRHRIPGVLDLWLHTFADLVFTALIERLTEGSQIMFSPKVALWGGLASAFGGVFWLMLAIAPDSGADSGLLSAFVLGLGGLAGLYSQQARQGGRLGLAGFILGIAGTVLAFADGLWGFISGRLSAPTIGSEPVLAALSVLILSLAFIILGIGLSLLGVASLRAKILNRWRGLPLGLGLLNIVQGVTFWQAFYVPLSQGRNPFHPWNSGNFGLVVVFVVFALLGLGWMALGIVLMIAADAKVAQSPPASP
jgi:hypothetical protein